MALLAWLVAGGVVVARWFIRPLPWPWLVALVVAGGIGLWLDAKSGRARHLPRRATRWQASHVRKVTPSGLVGFEAALRVRGHWGWRRWRPGVGWVDAGRLHGRRWLLPITTSVPRSEIGTVTTRAVTAWEALLIAPDLCVFVLGGLGWHAEVAVSPAGAAILSEWLVAGGLRWSSPAGP